MKRSACDVLRAMFDELRATFSSFGTARSASAAAAVGVVFSVLVTAQPQQAIEWRYWGGDAAQTRYSTASDISAANVRELELAWTWQTIDRQVPELNLRPGNLENTPIMIDDVLYLSTSFHRVVALNAETGAQLWVFDPRTFEEGIPLSGTGLNSRGVAFWRGDDGQTRILVAGRQRLFSIDAKTGVPDGAFGAGGTVTLTADLGREIPRLQTQATSPPVVYENLVIVGTGIPDRLQYRGDPPGAVQAFDIRTGKRAWVFFTIPQSARDVGADTWGGESWKQAGHANVWAPIAPYVDWDYSNYCGQAGLFTSRGAQGRGAGQTASPPAVADDFVPDTVGYSGPALGAIPLTKPPYAQLVAVDLNRGDIAWKVPFGEGTPALRASPLLEGVTLPERLGTPGPSGLLVTKSGLIFIGGGDPYLYAFDKATGREISRVPTPFQTRANPMTYRTRSGRQFVVVSTGSGPDATIAAFSLRGDRR